MAKPKFLFVVGTRPDAIKTAPVVKEMLKFSDRVDTVLVATGQHREMLAQALDAFDLKPDYDLDIMQHGQTLADVTRRILEGLDKIIDEQKPDLVFAQGDTTTTFVAGLNAFYRQIPFAHVEAGLRTETVFDPFPEEFNRRAVGLFADLHFPPTTWAADNLLKEGANQERVFVTGNTGIDAVQQMVAANPGNWYPDYEGRIILLTTHRRENWGEPQKRIAEAAKTIIDARPDTKLVVAMHRNPQVREVLTSILGGHDRIDLIEPPDYMDFVSLMKRSTLILTDSGGVQEEAPAFGVPVLVLRDTTERPEGVRAGTARLVGTDREKIEADASRLLDDPDAYSVMAQSVSPYGDGKASARIRYIALKRFGIDSPVETMWT
ncbi:MAG: UDP-N-acetylglucosamine 2-epimerase (non-hydrolyzing) [Armatimonadetes bacterium]|nr:UDP-N-acetylglucosamine 2-epimerase (non-hydrolyzing) [Armatimonadota bacterium]